MDDKKPDELVEKLLNEDPGDEKLDPVYVQRRDDVRRQAAEPSRKPNPREMEIEQGDDDVDPEEQFELDLREAIEGTIEGARARTYAENGVLTRNKGLVVDTSYGTFQVTIVLKNRA